MLRGLETGAVQGAVNGRLSVKRDWVFDFGIGMIFGFCLVPCLAPPGPPVSRLTPHTHAAPRFFRVSGWVFVFCGFFSARAHSLAPRNATLHFTCSFLSDRRV